MVRESSPNRSRKPHLMDGGVEELTQEITHLLTLDVPKLRQKWAALFGAHPSPHLGRLLLVRAIAYRLQERAFAGIKPSTQRLLDRVASGRAEAASERITKRRAGAGTVLIRDWRGVRHRVTVLDDDVVYRGRRYKSLSEVARVITGARWSGPLFFGLKSRAKEAVNG
jgi:hypothetical protein